MINLEPCKNCYHNTVCDGNHRSFANYFKTCKYFKDKTKIIERFDNKTDSKINYDVDNK